MAERRLPWVPLIVCVLLAAAVGLLCGATPLLSAAATAGQVGLQTDVVIPASADATIDSANPGVNAGTTSRLIGSYSASVLRRAIPMPDQEKEIASHQALTLTACPRTS